MARGGEQRTRNTSKSIIESGERKIKMNIAKQLINGGKTTQTRYEKRDAVFIRKLRTTLDTRLIQPSEPECMSA